MKFLILSLFTVALILECFAVQAQTNAKPKTGIFDSVYRQIADLKQFKGYTEQEGDLMEPINLTSNYGLSRIAKKGYQIIAFEKVIPHGNKPDFMLLDTIRIGHIKPGQGVILTHCRLNGRDVAGILALVKMDDNQYFKKVIKAWKANTKTNRFEPISTTGIDCLNDGYGAD
jgi:hypothetical protein